MFWKRRKPGWFIEPSRVALGSVIENGSRNLSRSHVRVKYQSEPAVQFVPLGSFIERCLEVIRAGRPLAIEHLLIAPIVKHHNARFFDRLTDWGPATRRAYRPQPGQRRPEVRVR
jgi:hypothetical protein